MLKFKKNIIVGVSISQERGLEVAQIDYSTKTLLKYASSPLEYNNNTRDIEDIDKFKETLQDLMETLEIPKGTEVVLNIPTVNFNVADYPGSLNDEQVEIALEEILVDSPIFQNADIALSKVKLPNSTIQSNKYAYTAAQRTTLIELVIKINELGYKVICIDTSVNTSLNALIYNERLNFSPDTIWVLLLVEQNFCRILTMQGNSYVESYEERISIGEVLGDDENYPTVINAITPILRALPSQCLYVVSKTNIIDAQKLAEQIDYNAQIIHENANSFAKEAFIEQSENFIGNAGSYITLDVIGAAITPEVKEKSVNINLFNATLGNVYTDSIPPEIKIGEKKIVLSIENMLVATITLAIVICMLGLSTWLYFNNAIKQNNNKILKLDTEINKIEKFLKENNDISSNLFDEGDEIKIGLIHNKKIYNYYTIVGTEIPQKLWLTSLDLGEHVTIEGQADNLESIYSFFRNIKDYDSSLPLKLQKLGMANNNSIKQAIAGESFDTESIITSLNADFYEFKISDGSDEKKETAENTKKQKTKTKDKTTSKKDSKKSLPNLEPID